MKVLLFFFFLLKIVTNSNWINNTFIKLAVITLYYIRSWKNWIIYDLFIRYGFVCVLCVGAFVGFLWRERSWLCCGGFGFGWLRGSAGELRFMQWLQGRSILLSSHNEEIEDRLPLCFCRYEKMSWTDEYHLPWWLSSYYTGVQHTEFDDFTRGMCE
jgi:hypothetical protein